MRIAGTAFFVLLALTAGAHSVAAQEMRDRAFLKALAACADAEILAARDRIDARIGAAPAGAAAEAERMTEEGLAACGRGDLPAAKEALEEAAEVLAAFSADALGEDAAESPAPAADAESAAEDVPWWQFW